MYQHLSQLDKVTVRLVIHLDCSPWVGSASDLSSIGGGNKVVGANDSERNFALSGYRDIKFRNGVKIISILTRISSFSAIVSSSSRS